MSRLVRLVLVCALLVAAASLSACSETRRLLGQDKAPPDEFAVVSRAPLSLPPNYALRPPSPGSSRPQEVTTRDQARQTVFGQKALQATQPIATTGRSPGEVAFLKKAGADQAQPDIRATVNRETSALIEADKNFTDKLIFWRNPAPPGEVIDPVKESARIRENEALGRSVNEGAVTPTIKRRKKGIFES